MQRTTIGSDLWIGHGATIKQGITIGHGAVIGSNAVVTKDVPPYAIVGGSPAKVIRIRFDEKIVASLFNSEWWNLSDGEIQSLAININNPMRFITEISGSSSTKLQKNQICSLGGEFPWVVVDFPLLNERRVA